MTREELQAEYKKLNTMRYEDMTEEQKTIYLKLCVREYRVIGKPVDDPEIAALLRKAAALSKKDHSSGED